MHGHWWVRMSKMIKCKIREVACWQVRHWKVAHNGIFTHTVYIYIFI